MKRMTCGFQALENVLPREWGLLVPPGSPQTILMFKAYLEAAHGSDRKESQKAWTGKKMVPLLQIGLDLRRS